MVLGGAGAGNDKQTPQAQLQIGSPAKT